MSELLDKQMYVINECFNRNSGIHVGAMQAHEKCAMKIKETKKERKTTAA